MNEITVTLSFEQLQRWLEQAEYIDADEVTQRAKAGAEWVRVFIPGAVARHAWSRLTDIAGAQRRDSLLASLLESYE